MICSQHMGLIDSTGHQLLKVGEKYKVSLSVTVRQQQLKESKQLTWQWHMQKVQVACSEHHMTMRLIRRDSHVRLFHYLPKEKSISTRGLSDFQIVVLKVLTKNLQIIMVLIMNKFLVPKWDCYILMLLDLKQVGGVIYLVSYSQ